MSAASDVNCSLLRFTEMDMESSGFDNCTAAAKLDVTRLLLIPIFLVSLIGNLCTVAIVAVFKKHRVADVLVGGLAVTDLIATLVPVPMSIFSYLTLMDFSEGSPACMIYAAVALFTRLSSCAIVTVISVDKCVAICAPFSYKRYAGPRVYVLTLVMCWLLCVGVSIVPTFEPNSPVTSHEGFCLFDFASHFAIFIAVIALVQFVVVLLCFLLSTVTLLLNFRSRRNRSGLRAAMKYEKKKSALQIRKESLLQRMNAYRRSTLSNIFQVRVEAQFVTMFTAVVVLFYISWLPIVVSTSTVTMCYNHSTNFLHGHSHCNMIRLVTNR